MYLQRQQLFPGPVVQGHCSASVLRFHQCSNTALSCPLGYSSNSSSRSRNYSISLSGYAVQQLFIATLYYAITESFHPGICSSNYYYLYRVQECFARAVFCSLGLSSILTSWDQQQIFLTPDIAGPRAMPLRTVFAGTSSNYFSSSSDQKELFTAMLSRI